MRQLWRKSSDTVVQAKERNEKVRFRCVGCGTLAEAPRNTQRASKAQCKDCFGKREDRRENELNNLTGSEWAALSKSAEQYNGVRSDKQRRHGAAFPQTLAEAQIKIYTKTGELVFDPFLGVGTTSDAAEALGRRSIGIELNPEFVKLARRDLKHSKKHRVICDDVRNLTQHIKQNSVDLILTSPPYATLLKTVKGNFAYKWREHSELSVVSNPQPYSGHQADFGNLDYSEFMGALVEVLSDCYAVLRPDCYAVWIVKDYRDLRTDVPYVNFHGDVIQAAESAKFVLWDIRIYDQTKFRPLVVLGYPSRNYYLNIGHSYILVFKKIANRASPKDGSRPTR